MAQTTLVKGMDKTIVGLPAIMVEESRVVLSQYRGGLSKSTSRQNGIQGDLVAHTNPEPFQMRGNPPARLIEPIDHTVTHGDLKFLIRQLRLCPQSRYRSAQRASAHGQTITPFQNLSRTLVRDPHLFGQMRGQRQRLRSHLHLCRSQGVGSLQGVAPLDMSAAAHAVADLHIEAPHYCLPHDVFLKLRPCTVVNNPPAAVGTRLWQPNRNLFIHTIGNRTKRPLPIIAADLAAGPLRIRLGLAFRKRRRLPLERTKCFFKGFAQSFDLGLRPLQLFSLGLILFDKFFEGRIAAGLFARFHRPYSTRGYRICPAYSLTKSRFYRSSTVNNDPKPCPKNYF